MFKSERLKVTPTLISRKVRINWILNRKGLINLSIYNIMGQKIAELADEEKPLGKHTLYWKTKEIKSEIYFCRLRMEDSISVIPKILLIK